MSPDRTEALEPSLTALDLDVLAAVPPCGDVEYRRRSREDAVSVWQTAETLDTVDLAYVDRTLSGLEHLGYVSSAVSRSRRRIVWWRTRKGDTAVASRP